MMYVVAILQYNKTSDFLTTAYSYIFFLIATYSYSVFHDF